MCFPLTEDAPISCPSLNAAPTLATPNDVHSNRSVAGSPTDSDSLTTQAFRALDQLAGQQHSSPDEPLYGRKDQPSVNWTTHWDERSSCFRLVYVGQPQLQMQCNSNAKGEVTCKRKHQSGDSNADDPDSDDDVKLSKAVKLVNIRHVTFAPEFV